LWLKERVARRVAIGIVIAVTGSALIGLGERPGRASATLGNSLALAASLAVALYVLCGRVLRKRLSWLTYVGLLYLAAGAMIMGTVLVLGRPVLGLGWRTYGLCFAMALGPQIIGHGSLNYAVRYVHPAVLSLLNLVEPV